MRRWIDLTNEAQHGGTREISLERAEEKTSVDRPDPVCSFLIHIRPKAFYVHNSRHVAVKGTIQRPRGTYIDRDVNLNSRPSDSS